MIITPARLPEVLRISPRVHADARGRFFELWRQERSVALGLPERFVQDNVSVSARGVLRGLHCQHPQGQGKLVTVLRGRIYDVAVDLRHGSPHFGEWVGMELDDAAHEQLYIPAGFAHGFLALADDAVVTYKCTTPFDATAEITVRWDDPALGITWPLGALRPTLSAKDAAAPLLAEVSVDRLPPYAANG